MEEAFGFGQPGQGKGGGKLRAVEQGQAFLGAQDQRLETRAVERLTRRQAAGKAVDLAFTDHGRGHVGQRRQVTRGADGALRRNDRGQAAVKHGFEHVHGFDAHARGAVAEAGQFQRHHQADNGFRRVVADTGRVAEDDIALKRRQVGVVDTRRGQLTKAGIDAIDGLTLGQDTFDGGGAFGHARRAGRIKTRRLAVINIAPLLQRYVTGDQGYHGLVRYNLAVVIFDRPFGQALSGAGTTNALAAADAKQRAVPGAGDQVALRRQIVVERFRQGHAGVRTAIDIAVDLFALADDKAVKMRFADFEHEVARLAVGDQVERAKRHAGWGGEDASVGHAGSASGWREGWAAAKAGNCAQAASAAAMCGQGVRSIAKRRAL